MFVCDHLAFSQIFVFGKFRCRGSGGMGLKLVMLGQSSTWARLGIALGCSTCRDTQCSVVKDSIFFCTGLAQFCP